MDKIVIRGGNRLVGTIPIAGAKNAALPLMAASLLTAETLTLTNVPHLADISGMANLLGSLNVKIHISTIDDSSTSGMALTLKAEDPINTRADYELVRKMRASILVLGPLLARYGHAEVSLPGGCAIGARPVDLHLKGLEKLGAVIELKDGYVHASTPHGLKGTEFVFPVVSVTGTENLMMAATLAQGTTTLINAAQEPEITDLAHCLQKMGAKIEGIGTNILHITGVSQLGSATHSILPDRIETGTYAIAAVMTRGRLDLMGTSISLLPTFINSLRDASINIQEITGGIRIEKDSSPIKPVDIITEPYPGFPTDLQAQFMAMMTLSSGAASITENIWENRFMHVAELARMGADIQIHGSTAVVKGISKLMGAPVMATDLRASVALVLAGLAAEGETSVSRVYHLDRGYEHIEAKLKACGADIWREKE